MDFTWQSQAWVKTYDSATQSTVSGPFTLSGQGNLTFAELVTGGVAARQLSFGAGYGGTLVATGDGTYNGSMTFPTSTQPRSGLGVLTPTANGFTLTVNRAASGPDAGAAFVGVAVHAGGASAGGPSTTAAEPAMLLTVAAGLAAAAGLASRSRPAS